MSPHLNSYVTATYGYALTQNANSIAVLGVAGALLFCFIDAHYLRQERAFRALYRAAVSGGVAVYDMNSYAFYGKPNDDANDLREENCRWRRIILSWSLAGFYGPILLAGLFIIIWTSATLRQ